VNRIAVVVPAHDEQDLLPACLASLRTAAAAVEVPVELVVVADDCRDATVALAEAHGAAVVNVAHRNVGRARAAGVAYALRHGTGGTWIACTDADTRVSPGWLRWQLGHARSGTGLLVGTVEVDDWSAWAPGLPARYEARYRLNVTRRAHGHVHGANLGFTADAYRAAGGFPVLRTEEDRTFVRRARQAGIPVLTDPSCPVLTSARAQGRAPEGFAAHLRTLASSSLVR
jgi:glycosyltransferase involved in cell wall biosynthesis